MADYRALARQYATEFGIPPDMFLRQIGAESSWNQNALSPAGAIGLAQLMPTTAQDLGVDPLDPEQNLYGGAKYLRQMYDQFGDWRTALAAYNAGPGNVQKHGGIPPFEETQNYLNRILDEQDVRGGPTMPQNTPQQMPQQERPQGLLEYLGVQRRGTGGPQGDLPFYQRDRFKDVAGALASGLNTMQLRPDPTLDQSVQMSRQRRAGNRTAEWLAQQPGGELYAQAIMLDPSNSAAFMAAYQKAQSALSTPNVQASQMLPDMSGTVMTMRDGTTRVVTAGGETLSGNEALQFISDAQSSYTKQQQDIYGARRTGTLEADIEKGGEAERTKAEGKMAPAKAEEYLEQAELAGSTIANMNDAISAIDGGAESGIVYNMLPNITRASASLQNSMDRLGLDVIGSVTFGALSEAELKLAMETAVPRNLPPEELRAWLVEKRDAQMKVRQGLLDAASHFARGGTMAEWVDMYGAKAEADAGDKTLTYNPETGELE